MNKHGLFTGATWFSSAIIFSKALSFVTQIVLGWILTQHEFGVYAIASSLLVAIALIRNGGTQQILVANPDRYEQIAPVVVRFSMFFNVICMLALLSLAKIAAAYYRIDELFTLVAILAVGLLFGTPALVLRARMAIGKRYRQLSLVVATSESIKQCLIIALAIAGLGVFSLVIPTALESLVLATLFYLILRVWVATRRVAIAEYFALFKQTRWIMLSNLAIALSNQGQVIAISLFEGPAQLGEYFFAMQIVMSVVVVFTASINEIVFANMASINHRADNGASQIDGAIISGVVITCLVSVLIFVLAGQGVHLIWQGKWDNSVIFLELLAFTVPPAIIIAILLARLASINAWKFRLGILLGWAGGDFLVALTAASSGNILSIAIAITIYRNLAALIFLRATYRHLHLPRGPIFKRLCYVFAIPLLLFGSYGWLISMNYQNESVVYRVLILLLVAVYYVFVIRHRVLPIHASATRPK